ncbi:hypothetical protein SAMN04487925_103386 [Bradyrhizobium sp. cf659]|nr:hypothetical protein SAMN04487925_103386 [Bradyrhizobium sp. cf659]
MVRGKWSTNSHHNTSQRGVARLFMAALLTFCISLVDLARETRIALHDNDLRM